MVEGLKSKVFKYVGYKKVGDEETCEVSTSSSSDVNNKESEDNMFTSGRLFDNNFAQSYLFGYRLLIVNEKFSVRKINPGNVEFQDMYCFRKLLYSNKSEKNTSKKQAQSDFYSKDIFETDQP